MNNPKTRPACALRCLRIIMPHTGGVEMQRPMERIGVPAQTAAQRI